MNYIYSTLPCCRCDSGKEGSGDMEDVDAAREASPVPVDVDKMSIRVHLPVLHDSSLTSPDGPICTILATPTSANVTSTSAPSSVRSRPSVVLPVELVDVDASEGARFVDCEGLAKELGLTLVVDVRSCDYHGGHIPNCYRLPFDDVLTDEQLLPKLFDVLSDSQGHKDRLVFCCMHGEQHSRLCAETLAALVERKREEGEDLPDIESVGFLVGGIHSWVNGFVDDKGVAKANLLAEFDRKVWNASEAHHPSDGHEVGAAGASTWTHACSSILPSLLSGWSSPQETSKVLRKAKTLLAHSQDVALDVVDEVAKKHLKVYSEHMYQPEDLDINVDNVLGSGSGGVVVRAVHRPTSKPVAVKIICVDDTTRRRLLLNSLSLEMMMMEESPGAAKGIMQLRSIFVRDRKVFLAMDFMDIGGTRTLLQMQQKYCDKVNSKDKGLPEIVVQWLAKQSITGIHTLHHRKLLHRDVKPDNILVNEDGVARIADFGISTQLEGDNTTAVKVDEQVRFDGHSGVVVHAINTDGTYDLKDREGHIERGVKRSLFEPKKIFRASSFIGTQAYLSPQMTQNKGVTFKEDIWALGIVIYEWSTGEHPFAEKVSSTGEFFGSLWEAMQEKEGLALPSEGAGGRIFSEDLRDIVYKCLRKRPSERPSAEQLLEHPFVKKLNSEKGKKEWDAWYQQVKYTITNV